jgi:outer membrane receptor protein involved in Fe transport
MQVTRPYGDTYLKNYWRGYRNTIGEPFLVMIDGVVLNHLWYNTADVPLVTIPLSSLERVEIVYGPASAVYGANALVGVINVITRKAVPGEGAAGGGTLTHGSFGTRAVDLQARLGGEWVQASLAVRLETGALDDSAAGRYEYLSNRYYQDRRIFGRMLDHYAGRLASDHRSLGLDFRLTWSDVEFGVQHLVLRSGYGLQYPADRYLATAQVWERPEWNFFISTRGEISKFLTWTAMARFRRSDTARDSMDFEVGWDRVGKVFKTIPQHWASANASLSYTQDFDIRVNEALSLRAGFLFDQKTLQKGYAWSNPGFAGIPVDQFNPAALGAFGQPPVADLADGNHFTLLERGFYLQGKWRLGRGQLLNLGARFDRNGIYGSANTFRLGYVGSFGPWGMKALFGQAYQEPNARELFGGWSGSGSSATLGPERSTTVEVGASHSLPRLLSSLSVWRTTDRDTVVTVLGGARNLGDRQLDGIDLGFQATIPARGLHQLKAWGFLSHLFKAEEEDVDFATGARKGMVRVPDLSTTTFRAGFLASFTPGISMTLRGRHIGARPVAPTNPAGEVKSYRTLDVAFRVRNLGVQGLDLVIALENAGNADYAHPGVREASAGFNPGRFDANGDWAGSGGYYNSILPQPRRGFYATMAYRY